MSVLPRSMKGPRKATDASPNRRMRSRACRSATPCVARSDRAAPDEGGRASAGPIGAALGRAALLACALGAGCAYSSAPREPVPALPLATPAAPRRVLADAGVEGAADAALEQGPRADLGLAPRPTEQELFGAPPTLEAPDLTALAAAAKSPGIPLRPPHCAAYARRPPASRPPASLLAALAVTSPAERDAALVALRHSNPVRIAAFRADFAPIECADAITDPELEPSMTGSGAELLVGLSVASKLARTSKPETIDALKLAVTGLRGYPWAVALIEAGLADLRAYDAGIVERKTLGRDSILTAFTELARVGVLRNARVAHARTRLAALFPSQRVDALDDLLLMPWTPPAPTNAPERALSNASPYWFAAEKYMFKHLSSYMPALAVGVPIRSCPKQACADYARARIDLGRLYWRRIDFIEAVHAATKAADATGNSGTTQLLFALARDLANGPRDAIDRMSRRGSALGLDRTDARRRRPDAPGPNAGTRRRPAA